MKEEIKRIIIRDIESIYDIIDANILANQYEPSERGAGTMTHPDIRNDSIIRLKMFVISILDRFGIEEHMDDKSVGEILKEFGEIKEPKLSDMAKYCELEELYDESWSDADACPKHLYVYHYYRHKPTGRMIEVFVDQSRDGDIDLDFEAREVVKKEVVTYRYEGI
jgi:hypothetical protein